MAQAGVGQRNIVLGLAAVGVLAMWIWLLLVEVLDTLAAEAGEQIVRSDLRIGVMTLLTGLLGAALAVLVSAGGDQLRDVPRALGFTGERLPQLLTFVYAVVYVVGILVGLGVAVTNEGRASSLLIAVATGGIGTLATGVAAWLGLNFSPPSGARSTRAAVMGTGADGDADIDIDLRDDDAGAGVGAGAGAADELIEELTADGAETVDAALDAGIDDAVDGAIEEVVDGAIDEAIDEAGAGGFRSIAN